MRKHDYSMFWTLCEDVRQDMMAHLEDFLEVCEDENSRDFIQAEKMLEALQALEQ